MSQFIKKISAHMITMSNGKMIKKYKINLISIFVCIYSCNSSTFWDCFLYHGWKSYLSCSQHNV